MTEMVFQKETVIPCTAAELFRWHEAPDAFQILVPPGSPVKVLHHDGHIRNDARVVLMIGYWPFQIRWELTHRDYVSGRQFCDVQVRGPFHTYHHVHRMTDVNANECLLSDRIEFTMPFGAIGRLLGRLVIIPKFEKLFEYRHQVTLKAFCHVG